ncbi:hypothetical protein HYH02_015542 [Chlamydomonas schloesseri]|uniref:Uncharacterized protein n=1 Tax=Chlamydomonas schloesseri TaxID=2026947 RepID=A0A835SL70_9CHLO|nr:hypothetical protein HYH02_015542 [Chlamydomonas schloesseri]|eukprot:KAG2422016.1 hypothetical protein HYH02_015542 [Chlamydomonas schloesseri]
MVEIWSLIRPLHRLSSDPAAPSSPENPNTAAGVASFSRGIPATNASTCNPVSTGYTSKSFGNGSAGPRKSAMMLPGFITTPPALPPPAPVAPLPVGQAVTARGAAGVHSDVEQAVFAHVLGSIPLTKEEQVALLRQQPLPMLREILHQLRSGLGRTTAASAAPAASSAALAATTAACRAAAAAGHTQTAVDEGAWQIFEAVVQGYVAAAEMQKQQQHKACIQDKRQQVPRARPAAKGTAAARAQQPLARTQAVKVGSKRAAGMVESAAGPTARQMDDLERPTKRRVVEARAPAAVPAPASARVVMAEPQQPQQHCQQPGQLHRGNVATGHHHQGTQVLAQAPSWPQAQQAQWQWGPTGFMCVQRHGQAYPAVHYSGAYAYAYT